MRFAKTATIAAIVGLMVTPAQAGPKGGSQTHGPAAKGSSPKTTVTKGPKTTTSVTKVSKATGAPKASGGPKLAKTTDSPKSPKSLKGTTSTSTASTSSSTTTSTTSTTPPTTSTIDFTSGPVGEKLAKNSALRTKIESRLTALGYTGTVYEAAYGFKNQGQFVAATNVSRNLGVSFDQLKLQMTGLSVQPDGTVLKANLGTDGKITLVDPDLVTNPAPTKSLGQAIQTVKSDVNATAAAQTATTQADTEIATTSTTASR